MNVALPKLFLSRMGNTIKCPQFNACSFEKHTRFQINYSWPMLHSLQLSHHFNGPETGL